MPKYRQISGVGMGMGFTPTWLRQVSPPCFTKPLQCSLLRA